MNSLLVSVRCFSFLFLHSLKFGKDSFNFQLKSFQEAIENSWVGFEPGTNGDISPKSPFL